MNTQSTFTTRLTAGLCVIGCFLALLGGLISWAEAEPTPQESEAVSQTIAETTQETTTPRETESTEALMTTEAPSATEVPSTTEMPETTEEITTAPSTTTAPRPSTEPVTRTGAVQSMPNAPLSTDPVSGQGPAQTVPSNTSAVTPDDSSDDPSENLSNLSGDDSEKTPLWETQDGHAVGRILVSAIFVIAAIVGTVAVMLIKFTNRP